jgi:hypothetical protein
MDIENTRSPYSLPMSPMMRPKCAMEESAGFPPDHLEPSPMRPGISESAKVTRKLASNDSILDAAADNQRKAKLYKRLWLCEVLRGDHEEVESYSVSEMQKADKEEPHWSAFQGDAGEATAYRKAIE